VLASGHEAVEHEIERLPVPVAVIQLTPEKPVDAGELEVSRPPARFD
jgi:hypothetical protein